MHTINISITMLILILIIVLIIMVLKPSMILRYAIQHCIHISSIPRNHPETAMLHPPRTQRRRAQSTNPKPCNVLTTNINIQIPRPEHGNMGIGRSFAPPLSMTPRHCKTLAAHQSVLGFDVTRTFTKHTWVFRDVVFQDVGFQTTIFKTPHPDQL